MAKLTKLTKRQAAALDMMDTYGSISKNRSGHWSHYPHGGFSSATVWRLNELGFCGISLHDRAQITKAGREALGQVLG